MNTLSLSRLVGSAALAAAAAASCGADLAMDASAQQTSQYQLSIRLIEPAEDRVVSNPRIMTLDGYPATVSSVISMAGEPDADGDGELLEVNQLLELVPERRGRDTLVSGTFSLDFADHDRDWTFEVLLGPRETFALDVGDPYPMTVEVTVISITPETDLATFHAETERQPVAVRVALE